MTLREALARWGRHSHDCTIGNADTLCDTWSPGSVCTCGLDAALAAMTEWEDRARRLLGRAVWFVIGYLTAKWLL